NLGRKGTGSNYHSRPVDLTSAGQPSRGPTFCSRHAYHPRPAYCPGPDDCPTERPISYWLSWIARRLDFRCCSNPADRVDFISHPTPTCADGSYCPTTAARFCGFPAAAHCPTAQSATESDGCFKSIE